MINLYLKLLESFLNTSCPIIYQNNDLRLTKMNLNEDSPKDIVEKAYEAIEIAKKTGKIKKGSNETTKVIERGIAKLVVVARDVEPKEIIMHLPALCKEKNIPLVVVPSKEELGAAAGLNIKTAAVAIIQEGDAKKAIKYIVDKGI